MSRHKRGKKKNKTETGDNFLKCNSSQKQMSHYLSTIRKALNDDVVTLLLGADKGKDFFINHNTASVKILHSFKQNTLAIIADAIQGWKKVLIMNFNMFLIAFKNRLI